MDISLTKHFVLSFGDQAKISLSSKVLIRLQHAEVVGIPVEVSDRLQVTRFKSFFLKLHQHYLPLF